MGGSRPVDGATVEVVRRYLIAAAEEMRATLVRTSFSPIIYEVLDFGLSIYDRRCELVAEAPGVTRFVGANDYAIRRGVERVGAENLASGDIVALNYPYWNGAHVSDATLFAPVYPPGWETPYAYLCVRAHWLDLGAKDAGYVLDSTDMHQEGLILPGIKVVRNGQPVREIFELVRFNSRVPEIVLGDLHAQIAALRTGERRLLELVDKFGAATIDASVTEILDHGERSTRRALRELPQGSWSAVDYVDDDGLSDEPVRMEVRVTNRDGSLEIDFAGSAAATRGPINLPLGSTLATCKMALKGLTSPTEPANGGQTRALIVKAEPGTLFHAVYPAPTFTLWTGIVALELIFKALAQGMPERLPACSGGEVPGYMMVGIHPDTGALYALSNGEQIGWGGTREHDGVDGTNHLCQTVVRNTPIEVLEARTAMLVERLELRTDSGGAGRRRGGVGAQRDLRFLADGEFLTVAKKTRSRPWALDGGCEPQPNTLVLFPSTENERRVSTRRTPVRAGDRATILAAGGGGHGDPREREPARVAEDVLDGYVSARAAHEIYGVDAPVLAAQPKPNRREV